MLCEKCKKNKATVLYKQVINGVASTARLCAGCAPGPSVGFGADINLFGGLFESAVRTAVPEVRCNLCGATYAEIAREGKVGCAKCYDTFADRLRGSVERIHGAVRHVKSEDEGPLRHGGAVTPPPKGETVDNPSVTQGVTPPLAQGRQTAGKEQLDELRQALAAAIADERYEDAARIRDKIKEAEENHGHE